MMRILFLLFFLFLSLFFFWLSFVLFSFYSFLPPSFVYFFLSLSFPFHFLSFFCFLVVKGNWIGRSQNKEPELTHRAVVSLLEWLWHEFLEDLWRKQKETETVGSSFLMLN